MTPNERWASRNEATDEALRESERERLALWTLDAIAELMQEAGISKADIARKLGTSRSHVTQVFAGSRNPTLSTIADLAWACGKRAVVKFEPMKSTAFISQPVVSQAIPRLRLIYVNPIHIEERGTQAAEKHRYAGAL